MYDKNSLKNVFIFFKECNHKIQHIDKNMSNVTDILENSKMKL